MEESSALNFPLVWEQCPVCGCKETVARRVRDEEKAKGKITTEINAAMARSATPVADQRTLLAKVSIPLLVSFYDVCMQCGCYYCVRIEKTEALVSPQAPGGGIPGMPGFGQNPRFGSP